ENSAAEYVGGAIFVGDVATIDSCTFVGNYASVAGGAVHNVESTFIVNSTFAGNRTDGDGGAISNVFGFVYSEFNTIVGNTADADGDGEGEGGGIATFRQFGKSTQKGPFFFLLTSLTNTVVANNADNSTVRSDPGRAVFGNNYPDLFAGSETDFNSLGGNIIGDSAGSNGTVFDVSDQVGAPGVPLLVAMGSLSDNGGSTDTVMPGSESIALDAANEDTTRPLDQRGIGRPIGKGYDVGSVERRYIPASIAIEGGDNQKTNINTNFADPLVVSVLDGEGLPAAGQSVRFTAPVSGASLTIAGDPQIIGIGEDGLTSLSVTANGTIGSYQVIAVPEDTEVVGVPFNLTNTAPPIAICQPVTVEAGANCQADVTADQIDNGSNDPDGGTVSLTMNPSGPFGLGTTPVVLTVTDDEGDSTSCESSVTVQDTTPPVITCPTNIAVGPSDANCHATVTMSPATATDNCAVTITNSENANGADASGTYSAGQHTVTFTATYSSGNISTCSVTFSVNCAIQCEFSENTYEVYPGDIATVTLSLFVLNEPSIHTPIPNTDVHFQVVSGPNIGVMQTVTTDANGVATLDLASAEEGEDSIVASGTTENGAFNCTTTLVWEAPDHIDIPFDESPQGWQYFSPEPFLHPTSSSNASLGITPNDNTNSFGFWLSPLIVTGRPDDFAVTPTDGVRGLQDDEFAEITNSDYYRVTYGLRSDSTDLSTVPTVRLRANTESLQQSDVLVVTASENGDYSPSTSMRHYPFYIHMPQGDRRFTLSFDLLNFDARDSATTSLFLDHVMIDAFDMTPFYDGESREELHQVFTDSQTHGWTGRDAAGFLDVAFPSADPLGLKIVGTESTTLPRGNAFAVQYAYWGSPEGANLVTMDHTRLYQAFFFFTSGATEETKSNVPTFRGRVNSGNMKYAVYVLSESMNPNCVTPVGQDAQVYSITFQTPEELDGQEMLFSFDWLWVSLSDNDPSIPVYLREISVSSFPLSDRK
ncbi:HYR domain-containing protein, partial [Candidatus Sumerlaeota bacterium]|nr:HYR domain-containing protein [Candidatus Sumerlaeota bacterium]